MSRYWVVVADYVRVRIYGVDEEKRLQLQETLEHPQGHALSQDFDADRPGRAHDIVGLGRHAVGRSVDPVEQERIRYASRIAGHLRAACLADRCARLLLVAGPHLLGLLRQHLDLPPGVRLDELEKNFGPLDDHAIATHLHGQL